MVTVINQKVAQENMLCRNKANYLPSHLFHLFPPSFELYAIPSRTRITRAERPSSIMVYNGAFAAHIYDESNLKIPPRTIMQHSTFTL